MTVDSDVKNLLTLYRSEIPDLLNKEQRFFSELQAARDDLSAILTCFSDDHIVDEPQALSIASRLWNRIMSSETFKNSTPGDNLLRLAFYLMNILSNDRVPGILDRIQVAQTEITAIDYGLNKGYIQQVVDLLQTIYENSAVLTQDGRRPIPDVAADIGTLLENDPRFANSPIGESLKQFVADAGMAFGGVSNPWVRRIRERARYFGMELLTILETEKQHQVISSSLLDLRNMQASFVNGRLMNYASLSSTAVHMYGLVKECYGFGDLYLGTELSSISGYIVRYLNERPKNIVNYRSAEDRAASTKGGSLSLQD